MPRTSTIKRKPDPKKTLEGGIPKLPKLPQTEEELVLAILKKHGAKPMSAELKRRLAAVGCLGMPDE